MKSITKGFTGIALLVIILNQPLLAQQHSLTISGKEKKEIIDKAMVLLTDNYIYPERVKKIDDYISKKLKTGGYDSFAKPQQFLSALNEDLEREGSDHHLNIFYGPDRVKQIKLEHESKDLAKPASFAPEWLQKMRYENFRFRKIERLDGNVGYLQFLNFPPLAPAKETMISAMNFMRFSSSIIIDLRENGGGYAESVYFLLSYFLKDSVQISQTRFREGNKIINNYVPADPMITKIPENTPVYILVGNKTSSAAEAFAYALQQYKRAVIVGEQTKGEGNPGQLFVVNDSLYMMVPTMESRNFISKKGIDGVGVTPDIKIDANRAYAKVLLEVYTQLAASATVRDLKQFYEWQIPFLQNELDRQSPGDELVNSMIGNYEGGRKILFEKQLYYISSQGKKTKLNYMGNGIFQPDDNKFLRLKINVANKDVHELEWMWDDGGSEKVKRVGSTPQKESLDKTKSR